MDRGTHKAHIVRATLEGVALQTKDLLDALQLQDRIFIDGGMTQSNFFCQCLANVLGQSIYKAQEKEQTAMGAFGLAGSIIGWWSLREWQSRQRQYQVFQPSMSKKEREHLLAQWTKAIGKAKAWV